VPLIDSNVVLPKGFEFIIEGVLLGYYYSCYRLPWILLGVPDFACHVSATNESPVGTISTGILYWLVFQILAQLELPEVLGVMIFVEIL
jgi:hypothetical protein